ncbi:MAG: DUF2061 domain-containing protein [Candidatus Omnitrophica bacterium]|nr:DUF2061 domain-containing protein [Candidatus Omnitrophota bacterium]
MDTRSRSLAKSITWRIVSIIVLVAVAYFITGDVKTTTGITVLFQTILAVLYYLHERMWGKVFWGKSERITDENTVTGPESAI